MKKDILFLDCTRLDGSKKLVSRNNANSFMAVEEQVKRISDILKIFSDVISSADIQEAVTSSENLNKFIHNQL